MDLGAYAQIEDLEQIAKDNGIEVPRLRGYRLMSEEKPIDWKEWIKDVDVDIVKDLCEAYPFWSPKPFWYETNEEIDYLKSIYLGKDKDKVQWDKIHGWKRRVLKTEIHNTLQKYKKQAETFNKYVGRKDILYIHARIGGNNWSYYYKEVVGKEWFLEKVDDCFDSTYCDIYAKIKENKE